MFEFISDDSWKKIIVIGDKVLIKPSKPLDQTHTGLYLPPSVKEKEEVQSGFVMKVGPGYPIPVMSEDEPWKNQQDKTKYLPLQAEEGDVAIYLQRHAIEIMYHGEQYVVVPQSSILLLERKEDLFS